jgi:hypothetical protein
VAAQGGDGVLRLPPPVSPYQRTSLSALCFRMPRSYVTLPSIRPTLVRLACTKCDRRGQYRKATLIERYGPDANMVDLRLVLASGCAKIAAGKDVDGACSGCATNFTRCRVRVLR